MAALQVINATSTDVHISDFYTSVRVRGSVETQRSAKEFAALSSLHRAMKAGLVAVAIRCSSPEEEAAFNEVISAL